MPAYAESGGLTYRFGSQEDRDQWVDAAPLVREALPGDRDSTERVDRLETLAEHGLARWRTVEDPDAAVSYQIPDQVIPAQVSSLPAEQAKAHWLVEHPDGPGIQQKEAAWLLQTSPGSVWNQLDAARHKLEE